MLNKTKNRAIIYAVGKTYQLFFNLTEEEAERRWQEYRANRNLLEIEREERMGFEVKKEVFEFDDEIMIWGDVGEEINEYVQTMFQQMTKPR